MKALVVDDSRTMRVILRRSLAEFGFDCVEAAGGSEALTALEAGEDAFALILVDWNMPGLSGLETVRAIRGGLRFQRVPLVMVTTETAFEEMSSALEAGANEYIMKPFTKEVLEDKLRLAGAIA